MKAWRKKSIQQMRRIGPKKQRRLNLGPIFDKILKRALLSLPASRVKWKYLEHRGDNGSP